jgi:DNA-binding transcriptional LysR family regulator
MELRQLELFVAVAEERRFTQAARRCHIAQSALSRSIKALEGELGGQLFFRTTRRVDLTDAGRALLTEARRTLAAAADAREAVRETHELLRGSLAVGGIPTPFELDQAGLLEEFTHRHPGVRIRYFRASSVALVEEVERGDLDAAFIALPARLPASLEATELLSQKIGVVCRRDHPLAQLEEVSSATLAEETFVGASPGTVANAALARIFSDFDTQPVVMEVNDVSTVLDFVAHGFGITLLPGSSARAHPELCAIPLSDVKLTWTLAVVTLRRDRRNAAIQALLDLVGDFLDPSPRS